MKYQWMVLAACCAVTMSSCINDLDVTPIDPSVSGEFDQDAVFAKGYASLALTGQSGPAGNGDVDGIDEGTSGFIRLIWNLNELTTDEAICSWGDPGVPEMNFINWSSTHSQLEGLYGRLYFGVTLANHFLEKTAGQTDEKSIKQIAETRFLRALNYYVLLDMFGNVPFTTTVSSEKAKQIQRADLFKFIEEELLDIVADQYEPNAAPYGRADKAASWMLLSRLYLNAEVYTGTARWVDAVKYAEMVIDASYELSPSYAELFMADNDINVNAMKEIIFPIRQDGVNSQSYAGMHFVIASTHTAGMGNWGSTQGWSGNRGRQALANKFFADGVPAVGGVAENVALAGDDRAMFFTYGTYEDNGVEKVFESKLPIVIYNQFFEGLPIAKFTNLRSDGAPASNSEFVDTDMPYFRLAEAYLTFAEANLRAGGDAAKSLEKVNVLRARANATPLSAIDLNTILDEKCREFYFEGQRRVDLIRYGYFTSSSYLWDWKGGKPEGTGVSPIYNLMPIPFSDINANENLVQNKGF